MHHELRSPMLPTQYCDTNLNGTAPPLYSSGQERPSTALMTSTFIPLQSPRTTQQLLVPRTVCSVCQTVIRRSVTSVKCNSCIGLNQFKTFYGLSTTRDGSVCRRLPRQHPTQFYSCRIVHKNWESLKKSLVRAANSISIETVISGRIV